MSRGTVELELSTPAKQAFIDITARVRKIVEGSSVNRGICTVFVPHTTAAVTINENADPSVRKDIVDALDKIIPADAPYTHAEGNSAAHVKASLIGNSETMLVDEETLLLGTWQGIYFCEFDGPRRRKIIVSVNEE